MYIVIKTSKYYAQKCNAQSQKNEKKQQNIQNNVRCTKNQQDAICCMYVVLILEVEKCTILVPEIFNYTMTR